MKDRNKYFLYSSWVPIVLVCAFVGLVVIIIIGMPYRFDDVSVPCKGQTLISLHWKEDCISVPDGESILYTEVDDTADFQKENRNFTFDTSVTYLSNGSFSTNFFSLNSSESSMYIEMNLDSAADVSFIRDDQYRLFLSGEYHTYYLHEVHTSHVARFLEGRVCFHIVLEHKQTLKVKYTGWMNNVVISIPEMKSCTGKCKLNNTGTKNRAILLDSAGDCSFPEAQTVSIGFPLEGTFLGKLVKNATILMWIDGGLLAAYTFGILIMCIHHRDDIDYDDVELTSSSRKEAFKEKLRCSDLRSLLLADGDAFEAAAKGSVFELRSAAAKGDTAATFELGICYYLGNQVPQDDHKAAELFEVATEKGHLLAPVLLAAYCISGEVVPRDVDRGVELLRQASRRGVTAANVLLDSLGIPRN